MKTISATGCNRAFSLIELSLAIFILALLIAVCAPAFVRSYNTALLGESARTFATTCQLARMQAVTRHTPAKLHVDLERQAFWVTQPQKSEDGDTSEVTLKVYRLNNRVTLASAELIENPGSHDKVIEITFYPNGTCDSAAVLFRGIEAGGLAATLDPITCQAVPYQVK